MRIIELCLAKSLGGLELYFEKCCKWLHHSQHYVVPVVLKDSRLELRLAADKLSVANLSSNSRFLLLFNAYKLSNLIENHNIDIVHIHDKKDLLVVAVAKMISRKRFKLVHTRQMQLPHSKRDLWHRFLYKKIDLYITITEKLRADAISKIPLPEARIKRLYYGVNAATSPDKNHCLQFLGHIAKDSFKIAVFSRIERLKGQHLVVEAAKLLHKSHDNIHYYFIGDVMFNDYFEKLKTSVETYKLKDIIHFKEFHPAPTEVMPCFDLILLPSYNETFGLVAAEAMRAGVAVIGTNFGGITEIIDHQESGLLFEKDNAVDLAEKIESLVKNPVLVQSLAQKGKEKADLKFNEEDHFSDLLKYFKELLEN